MTPESFVEVFRHALEEIVILVAAIIVPGLLVGLVVAVFQAATSINEQTLSFLPRLLMTLVTLIVLGHWLVQRLMALTHELVALIPQIVG